MTETDNYLAENGVAEVESPVPKVAKNVIVPRKSEVGTPLVIREASQGSSGLPLCRICLSEENEALNPLFSPCKCSGTMKFIHLNCL